MRLLLATDFQVLPDLVNLSIIGTIGAVGAFLNGLLSLLLRPREELGQNAAEGAVAGGVLGSLLLVVGLAG